MDVFFAVIRFCGYAVIRFCGFAEVTNNFHIPPQNRITAKPYNLKPKSVIRTQKQEVLNFCGLMTDLG